MKVILHHHLDRSCVYEKKEAILLEACIYGVYYLRKLNRWP